jgi:hypothetical protein
LIERRLPKLLCLFRHHREAAVEVHHLLGNTGTTLYVASCPAVIALALFLAIWGAVRRKKDRQAQFQRLEANGACGECAGRGRFEGKPNLSAIGSPAGAGNRSEHPCWTCSRCKGTGHAPWH